MVSEMRGRMEGMATKAELKDAQVDFWKMLSGWIAMAGLAAINIALLAIRLFVD